MISSESPFVAEEPEIDVSQTTISILVMGFFIIFVIVIVYYVLTRYYEPGEDYYQRKTRFHFMRTHGEEYDRNAELTLSYGELIPEPRAIDHYRMGSVYLINAQQPERAHYHFNNALRRVIEGTVNIQEGNFIIDRIDDHKERFIDHTDIEDLPIQQAMFAHYARMKEISDKLMESRLKKRSDSDDDEFTQKVIMSRKHWESDSQNVHDSTLYEELKRQLDIVVADNCKMKNKRRYAWEEVSGWLRRNSNGEKGENVQKTLGFLDNNYPIGAMPGRKEQDIILAVWKRAFDARNKKNFNAIRENLIDNLADCVENGVVVCQTGRTAKIWSSLAMLDHDETIGILRSKQMIRNEVYERCAKIVDDYVGESGSASADLKKAYNNGEDTEQVQDLIECITSDIDELAEHYADKMDKNQLASILSECKAIV